MNIFGMIVHVVFAFVFFKFFDAVATSMLNRWVVPLFEYGGANDKRLRNGPVAFYIREKDAVTMDAEWAERYPDMCEPLYLSPHRARLTYDEIVSMDYRGTLDEHIRCVRMTEAAHCIKRWSHG